MKFRLLNLDQNAKTVKGQKKGYKTAILYLAPFTLSGRNVCPQASPGCIAACLNTAGHGAFNKVQQARIAKTKWFFENREAFLEQLIKELTAFVAKAEDEGFTPVVRLNGTSDIAWERILCPVMPRFPTIMELFPDVQFYDYTKVKKRMLQMLRKDRWPSNYYLTFSLTENNDADALEVVRAGGNVAAVYAGSVPPRGALFLETDNSYRLTFASSDYTVPVVDGDEDDLRHKDAKGVIIGLKAKGKARKDTSGFVRAAA